MGHWLGLEHPFYTVTGKSCDPQDKVWLQCMVRSLETIDSTLTLVPLANVKNSQNDYVLDTPQMANIEVGTNGKCPSDSTDTCPLLPGNDPVRYIQVRCWCTDSGLLTKQNESKT